MVLTTLLRFSEFKTENYFENWIGSVTTHYNRLNLWFKIENASSSVVYLITSFTGCCVLLCICVKLYRWLVAGDEVCGEVVQWESMESRDLCLPEGVVSLDVWRSDRWNESSCNLLDAVSSLCVWRDFLLRAHCRSGSLARLTFQRIPGSIIVSAERARFFSSILSSLFEKLMPVLTEVIRSLPATFNYV